ncbi:hypothetical protein BKA65DRAFT_489239 [Rhexocercosporidium sp. MPI-PUGE-AT-0058]|nr:hypothetical protein BKA65DRAFT_489239 [Rhexocercosporidium sp. MPI-PUGE-AT-0058]
MEADSSLVLRHPVFVFLLLSNASFTSGRGAYVAEQPRLLRKPKGSSHRDDASSSPTCNEGNSTESSCDRGFCRCLRTSRCPWFSCFYCTVTKLLLLAVTLLIYFVPNQFPYIPCLSL